MHIVVSQNGEKISVSTTVIESDDYPGVVDRDETILCHKPMFGRSERDYNPGEDVIAAIARTAGTDDESPGSALERLIEQAFLLGIAHGAQVERTRIVTRFVGD